MHYKIKKCTFWLLPITLSLLVFLIVIFFPVSAHAEALYKVLNNTDPTGPSATIRSVWEQIRNLINYLIIAVLIYVAFLNILRIQVNNYAIKKFLPALIMGVILANFSFLICRFFVDLANVAMDLLINSPNGVNAIGSGNNFGIAGSFALKIQESQLLNSDSSLNYGYVFVAGIFSLLEFAGSIAILILAFLFFLRNYVIYFLVALSPLAFMVTGIPMAKSAWNQWWTNFTKWTFMPVISLFWLWVGGLWLEPFRKLSSTGASGGGWVLSVLFAGFCYYLAITTPFKMGGAVMGQYAKYGKQAWGKTGGQVVKAGKWAATGGIQSTMANRNQMLAEKAKSEGNKEMEDVYNARANRWTVANPRAWSGAVKGRIAANKSAIEAAPTKTAFYNRLSGPAATIAANKAKGLEDDRAMTPGALGTKVGGLSATIWDHGLNEAQRNQFLTKASAAENAKEMANLGFTGPDRYEDYAKHLMAIDTGTKNENKLATIYSGADKRKLGELASAGLAYSRKMGSKTFRSEAAENMRAGLHASSVVGDEVGDEIGSVDTRESAMAIRNVVGGEQAEALEKAAHHGSEAFDAAASGAGIDMSKLTPGTQSALRNAFGDIRTKVAAKRDEMVTEMVEKGADQIDEEMVGATLAFNNMGSSRNTGNVSARLRLLDNQVGVGLAHLQNGNTDEAVKIAQKFGIAVQAHDKDVESKLEQTFGQMHSGVQDLKSMGTGAIPQDNSAFEVQLRTAKQQALKQVSESTVASEFVVRQTPIPQSLASVPIEQIHGNQEALGEMTSHFNEMMSQVSKERGLAQAPQTTSASASSFFKELSGGSAPGATVGSVLADPRAMDLLAQKIGRATAQAQKRAGIGDIRAPRVQPSGNVTNVTQVIQNGPSTGSGGPRPPSTGGGTTIPPSKPE